MSGSTKSERVGPSPARIPVSRAVFPIKADRALDRSSQSQSTALFVILVLLAAFFSALRPHAFPRIANILNMATDASILLVLAVGSTFVILTGGIDLSINGVLVFSGVAAAMAMVAVGRRQSSASCLPVSPPQLSLAPLGRAERLSYCQGEDSRAHRHAWHNGDVARSFAAAHRRRRHFRRSRTNS